MDNMKSQISSDDKMLCFWAYFVGIPSLYIILTEKRKEKFTGFHGSQALFLWIGIVISWIVLRVLLDLIWNIVYLPFFGSLFKLVGVLLWLYAAYCGYRAYRGEYFSIPIISDFAKGTVEI